MRMCRRSFVQKAGSAIALLAAPLAAFSGQKDAERKMMTRPIPRTGELLPVVGLGNSTAFRNNQVDDANSLLEVLLKKGGSVVDTGGESQRPVGRFLNERDAQDELFLGTNIAASDEGAGRAYIASSQAIQGQKPLDLLQINRLGELKKQWKNLRAWKAEGLTRYIGVATTKAESYGALESLMKTGDMDFLQINYSILERESAKRLLPVAQEMGVAVVTNRPFVNGRYFPLVAERQLPEWAAEFDCESWAQFSIKFALAHPAVNCVITETSKVRHAVDNLASGFGRLPDAGMQKRMLELFS